jgi:hypothetical protein
MKLEETCPSCGAHHVVESNNVKSIRLYCGCDDQMLLFRADLGQLKWMKKPRPGAKGRGPNGGRRVPPDIAEKLRKAYGGTVTGRRIDAGGPRPGPVHVKARTLKPEELTFVDSKELKWPKEMKWDLSVGEHAQEQEPKEKKKFEGHPGPDVRSKLVRQFQDVFGRDD